MVRWQKAFTLIELLIVVAIIAILAAIAVPNFLEAQTRAKISRNYADIRTCVTAMETYHNDYNLYPYDGYLHIRGDNTFPDPSEYNHNRISKNLTTPVSYLNNCRIVDPFQRPNQVGYWQIQDIKYWNTESIYGTKFDSVEVAARKGKNPTHDAWQLEFGEYLLFAVGPDGVDPGAPTNHRGWKGISNIPATTLWQPYDATNGTVSIGNIMVSQKSHKGYVNGM
jgi:prepilin-type N-terminal cleavage/methylation domain-containing protein